MRFWILGWTIQLLPLVLLVGEVTAFANVVAVRRRQQQAVRFAVVEEDYDDFDIAAVADDNRGEEESAVDGREQKLLEREVALLKRENELLLTQYQQQQQQEQSAEREVALLKRENELLLTQQQRQQQQEQSAEQEAALLKRENELFLTQHKQQQQQQEPSAAASPLNLDREVFKMQAFESYVLVSALVSTSTLASLAFFEPIDDPGMEMTFPANILCLATQLTAVVGTMASLLSTVVFSLNELYGKSALGLNKDTVYLEFLQSSSGSRTLGFQAFSLSLLTFAVHVGLVAVERIRGLPSKFIMGASAAIGIYYIFVNYAQITDAASVIYKEDEDKSSSIGDGESLVGGDYEGVDGSRRDDTNGDSLEGTTIKMAQRNRRRSL